MFIRGIITAGSASVASNARPFGSTDAAAAAAAGGGAAALAADAAACRRGGIVEKLFEHEMLRV